MRRRARRGNRTGLGLLGVVLLVAGGLLAAVSAGAFGGSAARQPIYPPAAQRFVHDNGWIWPAAAAAAIVVGLVCLRWLLRQARRDLLHRIRLDTGRGDDVGAGRSVLVPDALTDVVEDDLALLPGVRSVRAWLSGTPDSPQLWITATAAANADIARLRDYLTDQLLPDVRTSLDQPGLVTFLSIRVSRRTHTASFSEDVATESNAIAAHATARAQPGT